jgi:hypothetical protein
MVKARLERKLESISPRSVVGGAPDIEALFEIEKIALPELPDIPLKKTRFSGLILLLFTFLTVIVGFVLAPDIPVPLKVSVWLLKFKLKIEAFEGKMKLLIENGAEFSVGFVEIR